MRKFLPALNLTALLALSALADLVLYRILDAIFLPGQNGSPTERWLSAFSLLASNLAGILALFIAAMALLHALRSEHIFPRSMRITVSTIGLFALALAGMGILWLPAATRYHVHLRISHGFLVFFLAVGAWYGARGLRSKLGVTMFALPIVLQAAALFLHRMSWTPADPARLVHLANALALTAMTAAPVLFVPRPRSTGRVILGLGAGLLFATALTAVVVLRFDLAQAVFWYGLRVDLTGLSSLGERLMTGAVVLSFSCMAGAAVTCLLGAGRSRLAGWGLVLMAASGMEISSPKSALFTLCGLLALAIAGTPGDDETRAEILAVPDASQGQR